MESSLSTPHCSFVLYLDRDTQSLKAFLQDVQSFFARFPLQWEIILVLEPGTQMPTEITSSLVIIENTSRLGRAASLWKGLMATRAPFSLITSVEMSTPLGDLFKILQHLMTEAEVDLYWGNRYKRKDSPFLHGSHPRHRSENFFNTVLRERYLGAPQDPLSEVLAFKKATLETLNENLNASKMRGWYLGPYVLSALQKKKLKLHEVPVYESGVTSRHYSLWRARWNLFKKCAFQSP